MTMFSETVGNAALAHRDALGNELETRRNETAVAAVAARAQAAIQAKYFMALQRPRSIDQVRLDLMAECDRPLFAEGARYKLPRGGKTITGWSIRFVEAAVRCMKNLAPEVTTIYDDAQKRIVRCAIVDLESNVEWAQEITIEKTVERRELRQGQMPIGQRANSFGDTVYIVPATDDDLRAKEGSAVSKTLRTLGLRLIPGDLLDEAELRVIQTLKREGAADPAAARKKLVDAFAAIGVKPDQLAEYLGGKTLDSITDDERIELQAVYVAITKEGERWADILRASPHREEASADPGVKDDRLKAVQEKVQGRVAAMKKRKSPKDGAVAQANGANARQDTHEASSIAWPPADHEKDER